MTTTAVLHNSHPCIVEVVVINVICTLNHMRSSVNINTWVLALGMGVGLAIWIKKTNKQTNKITTSQVLL